MGGRDGITGTSKTAGGEEIVLSGGTAPKAGNSVILTIDGDFQQKVEGILAKNIRSIKRNGSKNKGSDCNSGAAAVLDVKSGDVLALASYPTYDMSKFNEDYEKLIKDDTRPMWNRAISGI